MKLRLENGNFTIKVTFIKNDDGQAHAPVYDSLPTGLKPIDFVGAVVEEYYGGTFEMFSGVINTWYANKLHGIVTMVYSDKFGTTIACYYNPLNGKVSHTIKDIYDDDSSDDSGSGGEIAQ